MKEVEVNGIDCSLHCTILENEQSFCELSVVMPASLIDSFYKEAIESQKKSTLAFGFHKRETPAAYIEQNFNIGIIEHIKEFLYTYVIADFLETEIRKQKIRIAGRPRLTAVDIAQGQEGVFTFELSIFPQIAFQEWKYLPFKAPKRKNYKDLDRQVEAFLQEEQNAKEHYTDSQIAVGDWINYQVTVLNNDNQPILNGFKATLWLKIGDEEPDKAYHEVFLHKKKDALFVSSHEVLQNFFSDNISTNYAFAISILDIVPQAYFCLDQFKQHFRIKSNKEMYQRLIEIFSYRNDLSLRRSIVEESLKLLLSKHKFEIPNHLILRQTRVVLDAVSNNPDYYVYRVQKDFNDVVHDLAEKQVREEIFLDQMAYQEGLDVNHNDLKNYLNLTKRPRTRGFFHFDPLVTKIQGQEFPVSNADLSRVCLREKTVNHIIYHLTKK